VGADPPPGCGGLRLPVLLNLAREQKLFQLELIDPTKPDLAHRLMKEAGF